MRVTQRLIVENRKLDIYYCCRDPRSIGHIPARSGSGMYEGYGDVTNIREYTKRQHESQAMPSSRSVYSTVDCINIFDSSKAYLYTGKNSLQHHFA